MRRFAFLLVALASAGALSAAILVPLTDGQLVTSADQIVVGTVTTVQTSWRDPDQDGTSQIYTTVTVRVEDALKGDRRPGDALSFSQLGGTIGSITYAIHGMPEFVEGDRVLLFLQGSLDACKYTPIVGMAQGRWIVRTDDAGADLAHRSFKGSCFVMPDGSAAAADLTPSEAEEPLADVLARFRQEIARQAAPAVEGEGR
jgi:hypothetical protein